VNHVYHTKTAADTELAIIGWGAVMTHRADNPAVLDLHVNRATYRTIRANTGDDACRYTLPLAALVGERSRWTDIHACSAELAVCFKVWPAKRCANDGLTAAICECKNSSVAYVLADTYAASAEDAEVVITIEEGIIILDGQSAIRDGIGDVAEFQVVH
jgi:hypothetical protein